jgi:hypothetical protein
LERVTVIVMVMTMIMAMVIMRMMIRGVMDEARMLGRGRTPRVEASNFVFGLDKVIHEDRPECHVRAGGLLLRRLLLGKEIVCIRRQSQWVMEAREARTMVCYTACSLRLLQLESMPEATWQGLGHIRQSMCISGVPHLGALFSALFALSALSALSALFALSACCSL